MPVTQGAALAAIQPIDHKPNQQPNDKAKPSLKRQPKHKAEAAHDGNDRRVWRKRNPERARPVRLRSSQNDHTSRYDHECKQSSNVRKVGKRIDIPEPSRYSDRQSSDPCTDVRRLRTFVNARK